MDIKKELVEKLEKDCQVILNQKLPKALESNNEGTYRNLTKALETNLELIEKYQTEADKKRNDDNIFKTNSSVLCGIYDAVLENENINITVPLVTNACKSNKYIKFHSQYFYPDLNENFEGNLTITYSLRESKDDFQREKIYEIKERVRLEDVQMHVSNNANATDDVFYIFKIIK